MQHYLKTLFLIISILFILTGTFFLFTVLFSIVRPDILTYDTSGRIISVFVAIVCFSFAYTLFGLSRK
ncbi:MAG: hypothetical protein JSS76_06710 [Bacteroidetes bacterium]|nr:hypothetical protein [Bacteroidota bacterium]MBS1684425.1 hypothetical protein [Bacteroidota bacterium]